MSELQDGDRLSRFIVWSNRFVASTGRVKPQAFEPARLDNTTSVFHTSGLNDAEIWELGDTYVAAGPQRPILARGDVTRKNVREVGLDVERSEPPPRHANIIGWPGPDKKSAVMSLMQRLAKSALLSVKPRA